MSWSHDQVMALIESYKERPCLYAVKTPAYKNKFMRQKAYEDISRELNIIRPTKTVPEIKSKVNGLRTNFLSEHKKYVGSQHSGAGEDEIYHPTLWYYDHMMFILDHAQARATMDSINEGSEYEDSRQVFLDEDSGTAVESDDRFEVEYINEESLPGTSKSKTSDVATNKRKRKTIKNKKNRLDDPLLINANNAITKIASAIESAATNKNIGDQQKEDHIKTFGEFVASRLRMLTSNRLLLEVEEEITRLLFEAQKN